jgi:hypothetical protein
MVSEWGPAAWNFLHTATFSYPEKPTIEQQYEAERLFVSLKHMLPCASCRDHYESEIAQNPPDTRSQLSLSNWLVDLHNRVNIRLGKKTIDYKTAKDLYSLQCSSTNCERNKSIPSSKKEMEGFTVLAIFLVVLAVGFLYLSKRRQSSS